MKQTMRRAAAAAGLLAAALLAGCTLIPPYQRPAAPVAADWPPYEKAAPGQPGMITADSGWREFFPDPRLQALIQTALENNRDLRSAALRIEEARAAYGIQWADRLPNLNLGAGGQRAGTPAALSAIGQPYVSSVYQVGLNMPAFELDFFGRVKSLSEAALAQYLASAEARRAAQISLVAEVAKAYLTERGLAEQQELAQRTLESRQGVYRLVRERFEAGASSALDLRENESLVQNARVALAVLQRQRAQAWNALTLLAGAPLQDLPPQRPLSKQDIVVEIPPGLPSDLLERRPDIRASEQKLLAANANIGAARAAFFPRISLTAGIGSASGELSGLFDSDSKSWSFVPQLVLPIFDAGRNQANLDLAQARRNLAVADYEKTIQVAFREVSDALVARSLLEEQIDAQRLAQEAQQARLQLAEQRYTNGIASSLDLLDAQRELFEAEQTLVQARLLRLTNAVDLFRSLGGGLRADATTIPPTSAAR